jgi:hypothetical protein
MRRLLVCPRGWSNSTNRIWRRTPTSRRCLAVAIAFISCLTGATFAQRNETLFDAAAISEAFVASCDGYSSDELLIRDDLRDRFLKVLFEDSPGPITADAQRNALLHLLKLRKAGKLATGARRRGRPVDESTLPIAEIAARVVTDRHQITSDTMLADPNHRAELQQEAELISPGVDPYSIRKAVLSLRKRRALRPELVLRVADWQRELKTWSLKDLRAAARAGSLPERPGVYLFRSAEGYLYIGQAANLSSRLADHLAGSDRKSLAAYLVGDDADGVTVELHIFPTDSPASKITVRRAYESELIRSRRPAFNLQP